MAVVVNQQNKTLKLIVQRAENKFVTPLSKGDSNRFSLYNSDDFIDDESI
jgi:hypothetical protein